MPTYEYTCKSCKHELEIFHSMKDAPKRKCPECGKNALERKIGIGAAVLFKGSGFYETDYRSSSYKKAAEADKPADSKSDTSAAQSTGKLEGKPDAKPDSNKSESKSKSESQSKSTAADKPAARSESAKSKKSGKPKDAA